MTSVEELAEQLAAMQQQMANMVKGDDKLRIQDELYLVYNPHTVRVWCHKTDCPHLERESRIDMVSQPIDEDLAKAMMEDGEEVPEEIKIPVVRVSEPRNGAHPLGIMAVFGTEREAVRFVERYYKQNKSFIGVGFELQISKVDI